MKTLHDCPPLLVGARLHMLTSRCNIVPIQISMVTQKADHSWVFRATYKDSSCTKQTNFTQEEINEGRIFLRRDYAREFLKEDAKEGGIDGDYLCD